MSGFNCACAKANMPTDFHSMPDSSDKLTFRFWTYQSSPYFTAVLERELRFFYFISELLTAGAALHFRLSLQRTALGHMGKLIG
jgi:hypothetical protein